MNSSDFMFIIRWWLILFGIGLVFLPLTSKIFNNFADRGYIFSKTIGILFVSYVVFILGIFKILKFTDITLYLVIWLFFIINLFIIHKFLTRQKIIKSLKENKLSIGIIILEEIIFFGSFLAWSYVKAHEPNINGLEKFMDFGFINSILRAEYLPPRDMWFTPLSINYYYFGHFVTALLTKLSQIPSFISYNLMLTSLFAFTFTSSFSIVLNLFLQAKSKLNTKRYVLYAIFAGIFAGLFITLAGNLQVIHAFFTPYENENPKPLWELTFSPNTYPNSYWYANATRFIPLTIHEFPIYSFVVSDLHGHVIDIPFVLLIIALLSSLIISKFEARNLTTQEVRKRDVRSGLRGGGGKWDINFLFSPLTSKLTSHFSPSYSHLFRILLISLLLAVMYMTNAWDGIIYFALSAIVLLYVIYKSHVLSQLNEIKNEKLKIKNSIKIENFKLKIINWIISISIIAIGFVIFSLPFSLYFKPFVSGIGMVCAPEFLTRVGHFGPLLFEKDHCQRSAWWQLVLLYGFFYFFVISFIIFLFKRVAKVQSAKFKVQNNSLKLKIQNLKFIENFKLKIENLSVSDVFVLILIFFSTLLIIIPEFIYVKDIYPAHYRANTMFKLVYQAFIMLSISSAYILIRIAPSIKHYVLGRGINIAKRVLAAYYILITITLISLVMLYPYFATNSYFGELKTYKGLDGISYLKTSHPEDYETIMWLNQNITHQPVILEAQGDSYTDYARISANTGLPTVLGWTVHEWLWRGTYDIPSPRIEEVKTLYESQDIEKTRLLLEKYNVSYVYVADLERQKYPEVFEEKFNILGEVVYQNDKAKIYKITYAEDEIHR